MPRSKFCYRNLHFVYNRVIICTRLKIEKNDRRRQHESKETYGNGLIFIFRVILAIALAIIVIGGMMSYLFSYIEIPRRSLKGKGLIRTLYLKSDRIITQVYCWFLVIYITFSIEYKSTLYNYLLLFLIGLFLGYRITIRSNEYLLDEASKKKQAVKKESHTR